RLHSADSTAGDYTISPATQHVLGPYCTRSKQRRRSWRDNVPANITGGNSRVISLPFRPLLCTDRKRRLQSNALGRNGCPTMDRGDVAAAALRGDLLRGSTESGSARNQTMQYRPVFLQQQPVHRQTLCL
ncbi:unnamed protein product, partial [Ixodes pacificus]